MRSNIISKRVYHKGFGFVWSEFHGYCANMTSEIETKLSQSAPNTDVQDGDVSYFRNPLKTFLKKNTGAICQKCGWEIKPIGTRVSQVEGSTLYPYGQMVFDIEDLDTHYEGWASLLKPDERGLPYKVYAENVLGPYMTKEYWDIHVERDRSY